MLIWLMCMAGLSGVVQAQNISGIVYRDFNGNGTYQSTPASGTYTYGETGVSGVIIKAYNTSGVLAGSATSGSTGSYSITASGSGPYRVEYTIPAPLGYLNEGYYNGNASGTSVEFVSSGTVILNFGVNSVNDYCQSAPPLAIPCFVVGDPLSATSTVATEVALVSVPYNSSGTGLAGTKLATAKELGSIFGAAYQRESKKLFTAAFMKRHVGLGTAGLGGIYVTNMSGSTAANSVYVDLESAPFSLSLGASDISARVLPGDGGVSSNDPLGFDAVGKVGLGGMTLSTDGRILYVVDLYNRQLLALAIGNPAKTTLQASDLTKIAIPAPGCTNGVGRPFAVKVYNGKVYIGVVCTAENGGTANDMYAYVYAMDEGATTIPTTAVFSFRLNYAKGMIHTQDAPLGDSWEPWVSQFSGINLGSVTNPGSAGTVADPFFRRSARPQPMLSDIDFTSNGDMVMGFMDRGGHQLGFRQRNTTQTTSTTLLNGYIGGDLLRASFNGTAWVLEKNAAVGTLASSGAGNGQGPGTPTSTTYATPAGEFYYTDAYSGYLSSSMPYVEIHQETYMGSSLVIPGSNYLISTMMDPLNTWSGGIAWFDNRTGADNRRAEIYRTLGGGAANDVTLGKANGLGLLEALCSPAPIMIGNRVWNDTNNNGVQDAGEAGIPGVVVTLKGTGLSANGVTATTNSKGEYYFSTATGTSSTSAVLNLSLTYGGSYSVCFPISTSAGALLISENVNAATGENADKIDSDPSATGVVTLTIGVGGENDFSIDAAYAPVPPCSMSLIVLANTCNEVTNTYPVSGTVSLNNSPATSLTVTDGTKSAVISVTAGQTNATFSLTGLSSGSGKHTVSVVAAATACETVSQTYTAPATCTVAATIAVVSATVCYGSSATLTASGCNNGTVSWSNGTTGNSLITPGLTQTTAYTATCTTQTGSATSVVGTATVMPQPVLSLQASSTNVTAGTPVSLS
ncbi:SdrD B-like domain-containing protein, partial [Arsenicibacter rosenii]